MTTTAPDTSSGSKRKAFPLWMVIAFGGVLTSMSLGVRSTFGVFLDPVVDGVLDGVQGPFGLAIAIQSIIWGLSQPIAGAISDRFGAALTFVGGSVLYALALVLMSTADGSAMIIFSGGFLTGVAIGAASFSVVLSAVGRMVPPERRAMALGIVSALGSLGQFILVPLARVLIDNTGWRDTFLIMAAIVVASMLVTPFLRGSAAKNFPDPNPADAQRTLREDLRRAANHRPYLLLNLAFLVCGFHVTFIGTYLPRYGEDLGHAGAATTALAMIGLFNFFGSLGAGVLGSRYSKTKCLAGIYAARGVVIGAYLLLPKSPGMTIAFGCAIGVLWLSTVPLTSAMVADMFGTTNAGALFGIVFVSHQIGALVGALGGARAYDAWGSYDSVWWTAAALGVLGMVAHLLITEGEAPEPPPVEGRVPRLAPTVGVWVLALGVLSVLSLTDAAAAAGDGVDTFVTWCFS
ncbi:MAG: MFS transporter [Actinomycetota bacterium]